MNAKPCTSLSDVRNERENEDEIQFRSQNTENEPRPILGADAPTFPYGPYREPLLAITAPSTSNWSSILTGWNGLHICIKINF